MDLIVFVISSLTVTLALVALTVPLAQRISLPLPVAVAAIGLAYGLITSLSGIKITDRALDPYDVWFVQSLALDSDTLLYVFLPPLLFDMALAVNVRRMLADTPTVVLMAVFAVIAATAVIGLTVYYFSELGFIACLLLGAAVSTTDPSAVVATFREVGAPRRLLVILEGESLLNDAAAIALFTLLLGLIGAEQAGGGLAAIAEFLYSFAAGAAVGVGVALLCGRLYALLGRSAVAETSMTLALAYGVYLLAENVLDASGVVAVVFAGLTTGSIGFIHMGPRNWQTVRVVWTQIGFWASTFILLMVASLTPGLLLTLTWQQALLALVVYLGALATRAAILFTGLPLLDRLGLAAPMDRAQKTLVLWGGVRGAVTLVLALSLSHLDALGPDAQVVGALAAAFTLMTLALNASTLAMATRLLGLNRLSSGDLALRERVVAGAIQRVRHVVADLAAQRIMEPEALEVVERALGEQHREIEAQASAQTGGARIPFGERLRVGLTIISGQELRLIRRAFEEGAVGPRATGALRLAAETIADAARVGGRAGYEIAVEGHLHSAKGVRIRLFLMRALGWDGPLRRLIELKVTALLESERAVRELDRFAAATVAPMIGEDAAQNLRDLLNWRLERVREEIAFTYLQYPVYTRALEHTLIARAALRRERHEYERLFNDGVIGSELRDDLVVTLERRERVVGEPPRLDLSLSPLALLDKVPLFADLDEAQRRLIAKRMRTAFVVPDQAVVAAGERSDTMYFIASGAVEIRGGGRPLRLSNGEFFGQSAITHPLRRRTTSVVSLSFGRLLRLRRGDLRRLGQKDPAIAALIRDAVSAPRQALDEKQKPKIADRQGDQGDRQAEREELPKAEGPGA
ncbi:MAG: cation:proton antiporter [Rhodospirillales bacterium]